jgi:hypothetical protein
VTLTSLTGALAVSMLFDFVVNGNRSCVWSSASDGVVAVGVQTCDISQHGGLSEARERQDLLAGVCAEHQPDEGACDQHHINNDIDFYFNLTHVRDTYILHHIISILRS